MWQESCAEERTELVELLHHAETARNRLQEVLGLDDDVFQRVQSAYTRQIAPQPSMLEAMIQTLEGRAANVELTHQLEALRRRFENRTPEKLTNLQKATEENNIQGIRRSEEHTSKL